MRRREFVILLGGTAVAWPIAAQAQEPSRVRLIGVLMGFAESDPTALSIVAAFRGALRKLGWTEGNNVRVELRWGGDDADRIKMLAKELVDLQPDVILGQTTPVTTALARETRTSPIVFVTVSDPIGSGFAANLAHPGGNITGFSVDDTALGVRVNTATVHAKDELEELIAAQAGDRVGGLIVMPSAFNSINRELIIALAARYGVPAIYFAAYCAQSGGLISYGTDYAEQSRQAASYIDLILKGAKPSDLPVQAPTKFELVINLKTAKALGLTVPTALLATADEVIE